MQIISKLFKFEKDGFEVTISTSSHDSDVMVTAPGRQGKIFDGRHHEWLSKIFAHIHLIDCDCVMDSEDEALIKGEIIKMASQEAQMSALGIKL